MADKISLPGALGDYLSELVGNGVPQDLALRIVFDAAQALHRREMGINDLGQADVPRVRNA